jgi:hypothetical protein
MRPAALRIETTMMIRIIQSMPRARVEIWTTMAMLRRAATRSSSPSSRPLHPPRRHPHTHPHVCMNRHHRHRPHRVPSSGRVACARSSTARIWRTATRAALPDELVAGWPADKVSTLSCAIICLIQYKTALSLLRYPFFRLSVWASWVAQYITVRVVCPGDVLVAIRTCRPALRDSAVQNVTRMHRYGVRPLREYPRF